MLVGARHWPRPRPTWFSPAGLPAGDGVAGGGRQGQGLQQRRRGRQFRAADDRRGARYGPVRADQGGQRGHELRQVEVLLPLRGGQFRETEIGQPGLAGAVSHHVGRAQGPMRDPRAVQQVHLRPQSPDQLVADPLRREPFERAAVDPLHGQQHGPVGDLDHPIDAGDTDGGPLGHQRDERLVLDGLDQRGRGPGVPDVTQPGEPVSPVQEVGVALIRAERFDEHPPPVVGDRHELL